MRRSQVREQKQGEGDKKCILKIHYQKFPNNHSSISTGRLNSVRGRGSKTGAFVCNGNI